MYIRVIFLFSALAIPALSHAYNISNQELIDKCSEPTTVYGRENGELVKAGEMLGGYCAGFLQASLYALSDFQSCTPQSDDPTFLLSVYRHYLTDKEVANSAGAAATLAKAFQRICGSD